MSLAELIAETSLRLAWIGGRLAARLDPQLAQWVDSQVDLICHDADDATFYKALGLAPRRVGKADWALSRDELLGARGLRSGFDPSNWSVDQATRVAFILARCLQDPEQFAARLERFAESAEINELIAIYCGFAIYPQGTLSALEPRARAAIRSSMRPVYEAMAQRNPYPVEFFDQAAWNQMVVKSFFLDSPLWPIQGIDARANPELCGILVDLANERWAAGRVISPELWRCVAPFADAAPFSPAVQRVLVQGSLAERIAVYWMLPAASPLHALCRQQALAEKSSQLDRMDWAGLIALPEENRS